MKHYSLFFINPITILYLLLALIFNKFNFIILHYSIAFIHELFHYLMAKSLNIKVNEIQFLPIGFYLKINNLENYSFIKQLLVLIAGPLSFFVSYAILKILLHINVISQYGYEEGLISNNFILIFNLLPIYPLDGFKIIELFFSSFINEYKLRFFRISLSIIVLVFSSFYLISLGEMITLIFLLFNLIISFINLKKEYLLYLITRLNLTNKRKVKINKKKEIYRLKDNFCMINGELFSEKEIIQDILQKEKISKEIDII